MTNAGARFAVTDKKINWLKWKIVESKCQFFVYLFDST